MATRNNSQSLLSTVSGLLLLILMSAAIGFNVGDQKT
jgi:hypothetical protein